MMENLEIRNYKSIASLSMELKKLTILIGPNASGKSSILEGLEKFITIARLNQQHGQSFFNFLRSEFKYYNDLVFQRQVQLPMRFSTQLGSGIGPSHRTKRGTAKKGQSDRLHYGFEFKQMYLISHWMGGPGAEIRVDMQYDWKDDGYSMKRRIEPTSVFKDPNISGSENLLFWGTQPSQSTSETQSYLENLATIRKDLSDRLLNCFKLGEVRERIKWEQPLSGTHPQDVGNRGENTLNVLSYISNKKEYNEVNKRIHKWVTYFGYHELSSYIKSVDNAPNAASDVMDLEMGIPVNIAAAGFGFQQILPIIVQCFYTEPGGTIIIEEPEIHLHPANQMQMVDLFIDTVKYGNQVIIATHSEHMFLRLQHRVAKGEIDPSDIAIYYVTKEKTRGTTVERVELRSDGSIPGWLPSFVDASEAETRELFRLKARKKGT